MTSLAALALRALGVCGLALACAATPASAAGSGGLQTFYKFRITFQGSGTYSQKLTTTDGTSASTESSFRWTTNYTNVLIPRVHEPSRIGYPASDAGSSAAGTWTINSMPQADGTDSCQGTGTLGRRGGPGVTTDGALTLRRVSGGLQVIAEGLGVNGFKTLSGGGDGVSPCHPKDFWHDVILSGAGVGQQSGFTGTPLSGVTKITPSDLRKASFTKSVLEPLYEGPPSDCGSGNGTTCTQSYSWTGKITFVKKKLGRH